MRKILSIVAVVVFVPGAWAQVGEVNTEEIVIEKDKEIVLPKADKLYLPVQVPNFMRDSIRLNFIMPSPRFKISPYQSQLSTYQYTVPSEMPSYQNFVKAGIGNYTSPVLTAYVGQELKSLNWGLWAHHESFAGGSVRGKESGSSVSYIDLFGTVKSTNWAFTPAIGWQSDGYRFYGYDANDARRNLDKSTLGRVRLSATVEEIRQNDWTILLDPVLHTTTQNTPDGQPSSSENYFDLQSRVTYRFDSTFQFGMDAQLGAIAFESAGRVNRNFTRVNPWLAFRKSDLLIKAGVELATTNDTIVSGASSFFYPNLSAEWNGLPGWIVYGGLSGELRPVTFSSLSMENYFLDDSLTITHESVKTSFNGGIRGAIQSRLFLNTGIRVSSIENMSFFVPSTNDSDSARFSMLVARKPVTVFQWYAGVNWQPAEYTHLGLNVDMFSYGTKDVDEAWHKPGMRLSLEWFQQYGPKFTTMARVTTLGGITAPSPTDFRPVRLDALVDVSVQGNYKVTDRIEAFVQLLNLAGQPYERYLNYPNRSITFRIGGMYRF